MRTWFAADLRGAIIVPKTKHYAALTTPKDAAEIMRAIELCSGHAITRFALRMTPHVFVRPGELRRAEWSEFDFDRAIWSIPAEKMKMRWPHKVPLSRQVLQILEELHPLTGHGPYVFPAFHTWKRPMSENTITIALRRMGYAKEQMTAHGFRAMAATLLNEMGIWNPDAIERQLAHMENNGVRRAYANAVLERYAMRCPLLMTRILLRYPAHAVPRQASGPSPAPDSELEDITLPAVPAACRSRSQPACICRMQAD